MNLLRRKQPLFIHGDGQHSRRFLYAGDAADAFDTILHKGQLGQIYNVDSRDEISNIEVARKLLAMFGYGAKEEADAWIKYTHDRPFNDRRYAVDGSKLRALGWKQKVAFEDGLVETMKWFGAFSGWWGTIDRTILEPFPVVRGDREVEAEVRRCHALFRPIFADLGVFCVGC